MKNVMAVVILSLVVSPGAAFAKDTKSADGIPGPLRQAAIRETIRLASTRPAQPDLQSSQAATNHGSNKMPVLYGLGIGALAGFFVGSGLEHSMCEWNCPAGPATWGFTAMGAGGGAAVGWLIAR